MIVADDDDAAFAANETLTDNGGNPVTAAATITGGFNIDNIAPTISVAGTVALTNDVGGDSVASIGDTITYTAGTVGSADGDSWTVDLSAYGLSATAAPGAHVIVADDDDAAFAANETLSDNDGNSVTAAATITGGFNIDNIAPTISVAGTVALTNDVGGDSVASIGDTITYTDGTVGSADGDSWTVDLSAYGLSATAAPGAHVIVADDDDAAFAANETLTDNGGNALTAAATITGGFNIDNIAPTISVAGTVALTNDVGGDSVASIGDTITYTAGTVGSADGDTWTVDLSAYGLSATAAPGAHVIVADDDDAAFVANETLTDDGGNPVTAAATITGGFNIDNIAPTISVAGTVALTNDVGGDSVASIGDTITYTAGTVGSADGDSWTVDLSAYGLSATAAPGAHVIVADDDDAAFAANETLSDNDGNSVTAAATITGGFNIDNIAPTISVAGTVALTNDVGGDSVASIGDTITYTAGTVGSADGDSWTVDLSAYGLSATAAPGAHVIVADDDDGAFAANETLTDNGGNPVTAAATITGGFNIDNIAPTISVAGTVALTNDVGGDSVASIGDTITYTAGTVGSADGDSWTVDLSAYGLSATAAPGAHVIVADDDDGAFTANETVTDNGGSTATGAATVTGGFNIDNIAPTISVAGTVALTNDVGGDSVASIGDTITYTAGTVGSADGDSWTVDLSAYGLSAAAAPGAHVIVADDDDAAFAANETVTDDAGNTVVGAATVTGGFNIDNIAPTISVAGTVALTNDVGGDSVASIGDTITYTAGTVGSADGDSWTVDLSAYGLSATAAPGAYVIVADDDDAAFAANETLTDNGGNPVTAAATITGGFNIDNIAPTISVAGTVALTNDVGGDSVASIGDTITYTAGTVGSADGDSWTVDLSAYGLSATAAPGAHVIVADDDDAAFAANETLSDNDGNSVTAAATITGGFNIDNIAPTISVAGTVALTNDVGGDSVASIGDTITYTAGTVGSADGDSWTVDLSAYGLSATAAPGPHVIVADDDDGVAFTANETLTDNGGNPVTAAATITGGFNIDNVAPTGTDAPTAADGPVIHVNEEAAGFDVVVGLGTSGAVAGDTLELLLGGSSFPSALTRVLTGTDITNTTYTFTVVSGQLGADGAKVITAQVTDAAGNVGAASTALNLTLDTVLPTNLFTHATDASSGDNNPTIAGTVTNPHFSAIYNDLQGGDTANGYSIQVDDNSDFSSPVWDSDLTSSDFGRFTWAKRLGGTNVDYGFAITTDSNNNIIVTGMVIGNADMNGDGDSIDGGAEDATGYGISDAFISVFNSSGVWQWAKRLGGTGGDEGYGVTTDTNNNIILVGRAIGAGDLNGDGDFIDGIAEDGTGAAHSAGDVFITVFNSNGVWQWAKRLGSTAGDYGYSITTDSNNNIIVTGEVTGAADMNGDGDSVDGGAEDATGYGLSDVFISVFQPRASMANCSDGNRCADIIYAGSALTGGTQYYWRVRFYDDEGNEGNWSAGGGADYFHVNTPPSLSSLTVTPRTDGSGVVDISVDVTDAGAHNVKLKIGYGTAAPGTLDPTLDQTAGNVTATVTPKPTVVNTDTYQVGTTTPVLTSSTNTVTFDWSSATDLPSGDGTYYITITPNDSTEDGTAVDSSGFTIDNVDPIISSVALAPSTGTRKVGDTVLITVTAGSSETGLTASTATFNGQSVTLTGQGDGTYTGTYTVIEGHSDATNPEATGITLTDSAGNVSASGSLSGNTLVIDANTPTISVAGTVALTNDVGGDSVASIGDTITYTAGTVGSADGDSWTVDLSAYGLSAAAAPGAHVIVADDDDAAFAANETVTDDAGNTVVGAATVTGGFNIDNIAPTISVAGTVALTNDVGGDSVASIGDTITYTAGTVGSADGDSWTVDLSAYGLSATAAPGAHVIVADDDDAAFAANETLSDNDGNSVTAAATITGGFNIDNIAPTISVAGTVALTNDVGGDSVASIGDTITYTAGTVGSADGDSWTVDLLAYGLSATAAPGAHVIVADDDDAAFAANETLTDNGGNALTAAATITGGFNIDNIAPTISVAGTVALTNDVGGDSVASIGDTITYTAGTVGSADGDSWTVDLSAYGLSATAAPGPHVIVADDDDAAFAANETLTDNGGNPVTAAATITGGFNIDNIAPVISVAGTVALTNDVGGDSVASIGDTITYTAGTVGSADGDSWTVDLSAYGLSATAGPGAHVIVADDDDAAFAANETLSDNDGNSVTAAATITGSFNIDNIAPTISVAGTVALTNDVGGDSVASIGDTITYTAGTVGSADGDSWTVDLSAYGLSATAAPGAHVIVADDDEASFAANETLTDNGGNAVTAAVTITGGFNIDNVAPTISTVALAPTTGTRKVGDTVGITVTAGGSETGLTASTATFNGQSVTLTGQGDGTYTGTYTVIEGHPDATNPEATAITLTDAANNVSASSSSSGNTLVIDANTPTLTVVTIASNNADTTRATIGNLITVTITSSENIQSPTATIAGNGAAIGGSGSNWTATYTMQPGDAEGVISFAINFSDPAGNVGTQVTATTNASSVTYDRTTLVPTLAAPATSSQDDQTVAFDFTLPEAALGGSVKMTFTDTGSGTVVDANDPHVITFGAALETAAQHTGTLVGNDLSTSTNVASVDSNPNDTLVDGAIYDVKIEYQDDLGNTVASVTNTSFTYEIPGTAALTGTITDDGELDIREGVNSTIILTLTNDLWDPTVGASNAVTTALINGLTSAGVEGTGWNTVVRDTLTFNEVVRTSDTVVTITLPAYSSYNITVNETITVTIPATALQQLGSSLAANPNFTITFGTPVLDQVHYRWRNDDGAPWFDSRWSYRKRITIDYNQVDGNVTNFPVYVDLSSLGSNFFTNVTDANGGDIRVTTGDGVTELARQVVDIDTGGETGELHFKADSLSSSQPTSFYIYYGSLETEPAAAAANGSNSVWSEGYAGIWHLDEDQANAGNVDLYQDSSGNNNHGDDEITATDQEGRVGAGQEFDGNDDMVAVDDAGSLDITGELTVTTWMKSPALGQLWVIMMKGNAGIHFNYALYQSTTAGEYIFGFVDGILREEHTSGAGLQVDTWYQLTVSYNDATNSIVMYVNGNVVTDDNQGQTAQLTTNNTGLFLGTDEDALWVVNGHLDEMRISNVARTGPWISTGYKNQNNPGVGGFLASVGSEEPAPGATWASATEDTNVTVATNVPKRLRIEISNSGTEYATGTKYRLEVSEANPSSCSAGLYGEVPTDGSGHWQVVDVTDVTDGVPTTNISGLTDANITFVVGEVKDTANETSGITLTNTEFTEVEFALQATGNAVTGAQYCLRLTDAGVDTNFTYTYVQVGIMDVALTGTITNDSELDIRNGGSDIVLTLTGDTWVSGGTFDGIRQGIIDGLVSAQAEATGWNNVVQTGLQVTDVARTSATVVTITMPTFAGYDITAQETITATVPAGAMVQGGSVVAASPTFDVTVMAGTIALTGNVVDDDEIDIRTGSSQIVLTITDDTWVPDDGTFAAQRGAIIAGLVSAQGEANGWNNVVQAGIPVGNVVRTSDTVVTIMFPALAGYDITAQETITVTVPAGALVISSVGLVAAPTFNVGVVAGTVALTGSVTNDAETDIRTGSSQIILTLTDDSWVLDDGTFAAQRAAIIAGLVSAQGEANGWNNVVQAGIPVGNVVRTSNTLVTITLPALAGYDITAQETITVTVPAGALAQSGIAIAAVPTFDVTVSPGSVALAGTVTNDAETDIRIGSSQIILTLTDDSWVLDDGTFAAQRAAIIAGLVSAQGEANGWNNVVQGGIPLGNVVRTSNTLVTITLPALAGYDITAQETITVTVPASALAQSGIAIAAVPTFDVTVSPGSVALTGSVTNDAETDIRIGSSTILLTLTDDSWVLDDGTFAAQRAAIIAGLVSAQGEANGWNNVVQGGIPLGNVVRTSNTLVTITLPALAGYDITAQETITVTVPASALAQSGIAIAAVPTFDVTVSPGSVALTGSVTDDAETDIRTGSSTILLTLTDDSWVLDDGTFAAQRQNIINGLVSAQGETNGWNNVVQGGLQVTDVVRTSNTLVTITLPALAGYDITAQETITVTVPASALAQSGIAIAAVPTFDVTVSPGSVALAGTVTNDAETDIRTGSSTILLTLTDDSWVLDDGTFAAQRAAIIAGLVSAQGEANGWNNVVRGGIPLGNVVRTSNTLVTITLPALAGYDITAQETITVTVPASALAQSGIAIAGVPTFDVTESPGSVALTGTVTNDAETDIRVGSSTILLTLTDDSWVLDDGTFAAQRQNIINGLVSAQGETNGWNNVVQGGLQVTDVVRTSNTLVTITLPALAGYDITAQETITVTVPASALAQSSIAIVGNPTFDVTVSPGSVGLTGTVTDDDEIDIRTGSSEIVLTLTDDSWVLDDGTFAAQRAAIISGLVSAQAEANGWNNVVQAGIPVGNVVRTSNTVVTITLPALAGYDITAQETITVTVPASALAQSSIAIAAVPTFNINVTAGSVALTGTVTNDAETDIRTGSSDIVLTLTDDSWVLDDGTFAAQRGAIIAGLVSAQAEANGWNNVVQGGIPLGNVVRTSNTVVTITLPALAGYDIAAQETITVTVPASALAQSSIAIAAVPTFDVTVSPGSVALAGTVTNDAETDIRTGGSDIVLTLTDDSWVLDDGTFAAQRGAIIAGLVSAQGEANGWNNVVQAGIPLGNVVRTSNTVVNITLPALAGYDITAQETITVTVPASALAQSSIAIAAVPTFDVTVSPGSVALAGTVTNDAETDIRTGSSEIVLTLTDDSWVLDDGTFAAQRAAIISGLVSAQAEANGWNNVVQAGIPLGNVVRTSNTVVTITLPALAGYDITAQETITVTVPASSLAQSSIAIAAVPTFDVTVSPGSVALAGTVTDDAEIDIRTGSSQRSC